MLKSKSKILTCAGPALLVATFAGCGGRVVNGTDDTPRSVALSPACVPTDSGAGPSSSGATTGYYESHTPLSSAVNVAGTPACGGLGSSCGLDGDCCRGSWCSNLTYAPWTCVASSPTGSSCVTDDHCQSGLCRDYVCVSHTCVEPGKTCTLDAECCPASFCDSQAYGDWKCTPRLPVGGFCTADRWCETGHCASYQCVGG